MVRACPLSRKLAETNLKRLVAKKQGRLLAAPKKGNCGPKPVSTGFYCARRTLRDIRNSSYASSTTAKGVGSWAAPGLFGNPGFEVGGFLA